MGSSRTTIYQTPYKHWRLNHNKCLFAYTKSCHELACSPHIAKETYFCRFVVIFLTLQSNNSIISFADDFNQNNTKIVDPKSGDSIEWILDVTIAYPDRIPLHLQDIVCGTRPPCTTHLHYRLYPSSEVSTLILLEWGSVGNIQLKISEQPNVTCLMYSNI